MTLRSYHKTNFFKVEFSEALEKSANATFSFNTTSRYMAIRLDIVVATFGWIVALLSILLRNSIERYLIIMSLQISVDIIVMYSLIIRFFSELQNMMTSSQRVYDYTLLESEDTLVKENDTKLKEAGWPQYGSIKFENLSMRYRETL